MTETTDDWFARERHDDGSCWPCWVAVVLVLSLSVLLGLALR